MKDQPMNWRAIAHGIRRNVRRDDGQDLIEYGMLAAMIALAVLLSIGSLGSVIKTAFWDVVANLL
jgi:Flp pilus assembly pilin Flp